MSKRILMVLTSNARLGDTGEKTGFWLEEFAAPYYVLRDAGAEVTLASPEGGQPPVDPRSTEDSAQTAATRRFLADDEGRAQLASTHKLSEVNPSDFDGVFYPGGHGPLWDLTSDKDSIALIEKLLADDKPVAAVCHAPTVLLHARNKDGSPVVRGKHVTGFANSEEDAVGLTKAVPFLLEDELSNRGADYSKGDDFAPYVEVDGLLITGQNPASSAPAAEALLQAMG